ncbi:MAG: CBS domain-containing protein [Hyphomicrobiaceae bacterium]
MNVSAMLSGKGPDVITVSPESLVLEVTRVLAEKKIGSVVVLDDNGVIRGIVSERDIVRRIAADGSGALEAPVSTVMTCEVVTCRREDTINHIMEEMTRGRFRHVPVVDQGQLVGIVSIGDVVKHRIAEAELEASAMREYIATG